MKFIKEFASIVILASIVYPVLFIIVSGIYFLFFKPPVEKTNPAVVALCPDANFSVDKVGVTYYYINDTVVEGYDKAGRSIPCTLDVDGKYLRIQQINKR